MTSHSSFARACTVALGALALATVAAAQSPAWPTKPITLVVTYPPGGGADAMARLIAPKLGEALGQNVIVDNRPGAGGQIGASFVAKSVPDGHTLMLDASSFAVNPALYPKLPYDSAKAFRAIGLIAQFPNVVLVNAQFPAKSVAELIALARANKGAVSYASSGNGSAQHLAAEQFSAMAGVRMTHVAYKGGGPALTDVMAGQVPDFFASLASSLPYIQAGKLRPLAVTGKARSPVLPQLPTVAESGLPGYEVYEWNAVFVPAGTPQAVVERLAKEFSALLKEPGIRQRLEATGAEVVAAGPAELDAFRRAEIAKWGQLARAHKIQMD